MEELLTPKELAAKLKVHACWVYERTKKEAKNPLPCIRVGNLLRFRLNEVLEHLKNQHE